MTLNLLVVFRSGKKQPILNADYTRIQQQLDSKTREGVIVDTIILPSNLNECEKILEKEGVVI